MATAAFAPTVPVGTGNVSSNFSGLAKRIVNALVASRVRAAELELRRHEAFIRDLGRRQDHSPLFLAQDDDLLPFKI
ncbi:MULTISPECIES: hypothetical protein [Microvirga]|uniref:hypothetical protein n=1 Tax=Microvirga TaxID=186650 RepID=UPI001CFF8AFE|nr:hypothetical protein [Microvirga lenta]MCB5177147.1 hypothetical protein [Microvirga lenta]